jgi:hypothetical protein
MDGKNIIDKKVIILGFGGSGKSFISKILFGDKLSQTTV